MIKIDIGKIETLISLFTKLNEDYQRKAMGSIYKLILEQEATELVERKIIDESCNIVDKSSLIKNEINKRARSIVEISNNINKLNDEQKAQVIILMESLKPETFTKEDHISITINSKSYTLKEYISKQFHNVDFNKAKNNVESYIANIETK